MVSQTNHDATDTSPAFERNLARLLGQAYEQPSIRVAFRDDLLSRLKHRQRQNRLRRRQRVISLYVSLAAAASVCLVIGMSFLSPAQPGGFEAVPGGEAHASVAEAPSPARDAVVPSANPVLAGRSAPPQATTRTVSLHPGRLASLTRPSARAVEPLDFRPCSGSAWAHLSKDEGFTLVDGAEIRTPVGSLEPALVVIEGGPAILLDGYTRVCLEEGQIRLSDGRTVLSVPEGAEAVPVRVAGHTVVFEPGTMAFLAVDQGEAFAEGGAPAPIVTILRGSAYPVHATEAPLLAGRVYHLYDTPTGRFPGRNLGENELERFQPKMNVVQVANQY